MDLRGKPCCSAQHVRTSKSRNPHEFHQNGTCWWCQLTLCFFLLIQSLCNLSKERCVSLLENSGSCQCGILLNNVLGIGPHVKSEAFSVIMFDGGVMSSKNTAQISNVVDQDSLSKIFPKPSMLVLITGKDKIINVYDHRKMVIWKDKCRAILFYGHSSHCDEFFCQMTLPMRSTFRVSVQTTEQPDHRLPVQGNPVAVKPLLRPNLTRQTDPSLNQTFQPTL